MIHHVSSSEARRSFSRARSIHPSSPNVFDFLLFRILSYLLASNPQPRILRKASCKNTSIFLTMLRKDAKFSWPRRQNLLRDLCLKFSRKIRRYKTSFSEHKAVLSALACKWRLLRAVVWAGPAPEFNLHRFSTRHVRARDLCLSPWTRVIKT